jgi:penicillin-binding protein 1A
LGTNSTIESLERFGFKKDQLPANLSLALGSASLTPLQIASGFTVFANGGYRINPYYLDELKNSKNETIFKAEPIRVCRECSHVTVDSKINSEQISDSDAANALEPEKPNASVSQSKIAQSILDPRVNYIMDSILADVITRGTAQAALSLGRSDIRGKTGTTNEQVDAWFTGYNGNIVATAWIGFDTPQTLGKAEYGAVAALPIWLTFMKGALAGTKEKTLPRPNNLVTVKINSQTGEAAKPGDKDAIFEIFLEESAPQLSSTQQNTSIKDDASIKPEELF